MPEITSKPSAADRARVPPLIVIYRGLRPHDILTATEHLIEAGFTSFEVSLTSEDAVQSVALLHGNYGEHALIGAGTVRSVDDVRRVFDAGARMVLSPETDAAVIRETNALGMTSIPGAYTPTEISTAHRAGGDLVKLFPAGPAGPSYLRLIRDPLPDIPLLVTGGVTAQAAREFLTAGAVSVGVGLGLLAGDAASERDWKQLAKRAIAYRETALARIDAPD